jgi:hypothetical protein
MYILKLCLCENYVSMLHFFVNVLISVPVIIMKVEAPDALLQELMLLRLRSEREMGLKHFL